MKKLALLSGLLLVLFGQVSAQTVDISSIKVTPEAPGFFKPGETMTLTIEKAGHNNWSDDTVFMMIVLSQDNAISNDDNILEISGNSLTAKPFASVADAVPFKSTNTPQVYNYNFVVPAGLNGNYYIIVQVGRKAIVHWGNNPKITNGNWNGTISGSIKTKYIEVEFSGSKHMLTNTAWSGEKSSTATLIIRTSQKLDVIAAPGNTTFQGNNFPTVELKAVDPSGANVTNGVTIKYTIYDANGNAILSNQTYDPSKKIPLKLEYFTGESVKIKAQATSSSGDWEPSPEREWTYIRDVPKASGINAWYYDTQGQGNITKVVIHTTIEVDNKPDEIKLVSPTGKDTITVSKNEIELLDDKKTLVVEKDVIFSFEQIGEKTDFTSKELGKFSGLEYNGGWFEIGDSIAPVPVSAKYTPGKIDEVLYRQSQEIKRFPDILQVTFSEPIYFVSKDDIFKFNAGGYDLVLKFIDSDGTTARFEVIDGGEKVSEGDILCVRPNKIKDVHYVEQDNETRYVPIEILSIPYLLITTPVSPALVGKEQVVAVADFLTKIDAEHIDRVNVSGRIIDATGNLVVQFNGFGKNGATGAYCELVDKGGTHKILVNWDGKNHVGRNVGAGTYLVILHINGPDNKPNDATAIIGVKSQGAK